PAFRNSDQRPLRRSDEGQAAARAGAGGRVARRLRAGTHAARHHDDARPAFALRADALPAERGATGPRPSSADPLSSSDQAAAASLPLKVSPCLPAEMTTFSPSLTRPDRMSSDSGSCTDF